MEKARVNDSRPSLVSFAPSKLFFITVRDNQPGEISFFPSHSIKNLKRSSMSLHLSACGIYGISSGLERYPSVNCRAAVALRFNPKFPANQLQPFPHDGEAEPGSFQSLLGIKARHRITHSQMDLIRFNTQRHFELS
jgi:hypothetical protein